MFDAMGDVESAFAKLAASEQPLDVVRLHVLRDRFEALWLRAVDDYNRAEDWVDEGFVNAASALRVKCSMEQGVANASLRLGRKLHQLPVVAEAFAAGRSRVSTCRRSRTHARPSGRLRSRSWRRRSSMPPAPQRLGCWVRS